MALREVTQYYDDLDNTQLSEDEVEIIRFGVGNKNYILDVSKENAEKFHEALAPFIEAARRAPETSKKNNNANRVNPREVRDWAQQRGIEVARRGKIPSEIIQQYKDAHGLR